MKKKFKSYLKKLINLKYFPIIIIALFAVLSIFPQLFGKYHSGSDIGFHLASIKTFADYLPFSIFYKVFPDMSYDFGFGMGIFYPPFPHIIGAIIYKFISIFGFGLLVSNMILCFLTFFFIGLSMYVLANKVFKNKEKSLIASLFYMTYNYVYVDIIMRDAINEAFVFIFIPLIFLGVWYLLKENNKKMFYATFITGYIGLMYSHLVMAVWFTIFFVVFLLFFVKDVFKKENFISFVIASLIILVFTSTFYVPMIQHKLFGNYVAFAEDRTMTMNNLWYMPPQGFFTYYAYADPCSSGLIYANFNYLVTIFLILGLYRLFTKKIPLERRKFMMATFVFGILALLFNTFVRIWLYVPDILLSIQFIWRLATFVGFAFCFFAAEGLDLFLELFKKKYVKVALGIIIVFLAIFTKQNLDKTVADDINIRPRLNYYVGVREHYPVNAHKNTKYYEKRSHDVLVAKGKADIKILSNKTPSMKFKVTNLEKEATLELPRFYYLGYRITDSKGNIIKYNEDKYGFITINVDKNDIYSVKYVGTKAYQAACIVKGVMCIVLIIYACKKYLINVKHIHYNRNMYENKIK